MRRVLALKWDHVRGWHQGRQGVGQRQLDHPVAPDVLDVIGVGVNPEAVFRAEAVARPVSERARAR